MVSSIDLHPLCILLFCFSGNDCRRAALQRAMMAVFNWEWEARRTTVDPNVRPVTSLSCPMGECEYPPSVMESVFRSSFHTLAYHLKRHLKPCNSRKETLFIRLAARTLHSAAWSDFEVKICRIGGLLYSRKRTGAPDLHKMEQKLNTMANRQLDGWT